MRVTREGASKCLSADQREIQGGALPGQGSILSHYTGTCVHVHMCVCVRACVHACMCV